MQAQPTPGGARDRSDEPRSEKYTPCSTCGDPADGIDARTREPCCRDCGRIRTDGGGAIRVTCRDCGLDRLWFPEDGREHHEHDRDTDHEVTYEAADDRPIRCDGGVQKPKADHHTVTSSVTFGPLGRNIMLEFSSDGDNVSGEVEIEVTGAHSDYPIPARLARELEDAVCERLVEFAEEMGEEGGEGGAADGD